MPLMFSHPSVLTETEAPPLFSHPHHSSAERPREARGEVAYKREYLVEFRSRMSSTRDDSSIKVDIMNESYADETIEKIGSVP